MLPFVGLLWVPLYARDHPRLFGFPFFYWYQFGWGVLTIAILAVVSRSARPVVPVPPGPAADDDP